MQNMGHLAMLYILLCLRYLLPNLILNGVHAAQNGIDADHAITYAAVGDNVTLKCNILDKTSEGTQRWRIGNDVIVACCDLNDVDPKFNRIEVIRDKEKREFNLLLRNFNESDIGTYKCDMQTEGGITEQNTILLAKEKNLEKNNDTSSDNEEKNLENDRDTGKDDDASFRMKIGVVVSGCITMIVLSIGLFFGRKKIFNTKKVGSKIRVSQGHQNRENIISGDSSHGLDQSARIVESSANECKIYDYVGKEDLCTGGYMSIDDLKQCQDNQNNHCDKLKTNFLMASSMRSAKLNHLNFQSMCKEQDRIHLNKAPSCRSEECGNTSRYISMHELKQDTRNENSYCDNLKSHFCQESSEESVELNHLNFECTRKNQGRTHLINAPLMSEECENKLSKYTSMHNLKSHFRRDSPMGSAELNDIDFQSMYKEQDRIHLNKAPSCMSEECGNTSRYISMHELKQDTRNRNSYCDNLKSHFRQDSPVESVELKHLNFESMAKNQGRTHLINAPLMSEECENTLSKYTSMHNLKSHFRQDSPMGSAELNDIDFQSTCEKQGRTHLLKAPFMSEECENTLSKYTSMHNLKSHFRQDSPMGSAELNDIDFQSTCEKQGRTHLLKAPFMSEECENTLIKYTSMHEQTQDQDNQNKHWVKLKCNFRQTSPMESPELNQSTCKNENRRRIHIATCLCYECDSSKHDLKQDRNDQYDNLIPLDSPMENVKLNHHDFQSTCEKQGRSHLHDAPCEEYETSKPGTNMDFT